MLSFLNSAGRAVLLGSWLALGCQAHDGPEHEIEELAAEIKTQGETPDLLVRRAIEYNVLGKSAEAANDLERALELEPESLTARRELSLAYFALGRTNEALTTVTRALQSRGQPAEEASLLVTRAGFFRARREFRKALEDVSQALQKSPGNVEWYFIRSQLQAVLKLKAERAQGLEEARWRTGSGLLMGEWVDALIDNGQSNAARDTIERELRQSRWKSAWLIRRAKARLGMGDPPGAKEDLLAALEELNLRLTVSAADALLLADRGVAYDLLGKRDEARRDYAAARDRGLTDEWIRERLRALREPGKAGD